MPPNLAITTSNPVRESFGFGHRVNVTIRQYTRLVLAFFIRWLFILFLKVFLTLINVSPSFINVFLSFIITDVYYFMFIRFLLKKSFDTLFLGRNLFQFLITFIFIIFGFLCLCRLCGDFSLCLCNWW